MSSWEVELREGRIVLRPLSPRDGSAWREVRSRNADWLRPWEATVPPGTDAAARTFRTLVRDLRAQARERRALPFAVTVDGAFAGQLTVMNIVGGSARWGQIGYWIDRRYAGQNVIPTCVALAVDHCMLGLGLHRIEVSIRPENVASLRVVEKLGFTEIGFAPRYLHIDGAWRDHKIFQITREEIGAGLTERFRHSTT
ncbi:MAG: GNAT family N-acetyltransferase [Nocardioidaceae bacterium]